MVGIIIAVFIIVLLMITLMSLMLKKIIATLNDKSKTYFINKLQSYDELVDVKSKQLEHLNNRIKELENKEISNEEKGSENNASLYYDLKVPSYKDDKLFNHLKKINDEFNVNTADIIKKFIKDNIILNDDDLYQTLLSIRNKLSFEKTYELLLLDVKKQTEAVKNILNKSELKIFNEYSSGEFNILDFINYIDNLLKAEDPTIYVRVGNRAENYDNLNSYIKTIYDEKIYMGVLIVYKNKLYDYSLS